MTEAVIIEILRRYSVRLHYKATQEAKHGLRRYAVFRSIDGSPQPVSEPLAHRHANEARDALIAADILALFGATE